MTHKAPLFLTYNATRATICTLDTGMPLIVNFTPTLSENLHHFINVGLVLNDRVKLFISINKIC